MSAVDQSPIATMRKILHILGQLEDRDLQWILDSGEPRSVAAGETIISEGVPLDDLFIVIDGELVVSRAGHELARLGSGEVIGDMSLLDSRPPTATVAASEESAVFAVRQSLLRSKLHQDQGFAARFYRAICIFLANRLEQAGSGTGPSSPSASQADELTPDNLGSAALAGARFDWFLQRIKSA